MAKEKLKADLKCEIEEVYGFLNKEHTMVYARVSWNGRKAKDEIRKCTEDDGELHLSKGVALLPAEVETLCKIFRHEVKPDKGSFECVDFDEIFRSGEGIMDKRNAGYRTEDGFTVLSRKH